MDFKSLKKGLLATAVVAVFGIVGCGGGDAPQAAIAEADKAALNEESSSELATSLDQLGTSFANFGNGITPDSTENSLVKRTAETLYRVTKNKMSAADAGTETCTQGGTVDYSTTETSASFTLHNCKESGIVYNGSVSASLNSTQTAVTVRSSGFSATADNGDYVKIDSLTATAEFENDEFTSLTVAVTGSAKAGEDTIEFNIRKMKITESSFYFDGDIKTDCIGGWITITTPTKFQFTQSGDLTAGKLVISGQGGATITIEVLDNGERVRLTEPNGNMTDYESMEKLLEAQAEAGSCAI